MIETEDEYDSPELSKEIKEGNNLISRFMGYYLRENFMNSSYWWHSADSKIWGKGTWTPAFQEFDYQWHCDFQWLIKVVEAIEAIRNEEFGWFQVTIQSNTCSIYSKYLPETYMNRGKPTYMSDPNAVFPTKIESTWYNVVAFIKFWNSQNK